MWDGEKFTTLLTAQRISSGNIYRLISNSGSIDARDIIITAKQRSINISNLAGLDPIQHYTEQSESEDDMWLPGVFLKSGHIIGDTVVLWYRPSIEKLLSIDPKAEVTESISKILSVPQYEIKSNIILEICKRYDNRILSPELYSTYYPSLVAGLTHNNNCYRSRHQILTASILCATHRSKPSLSISRGDKQYSADLYYTLRYDMPPFHMTRVVQEDICHLVSVTTESGYIAAGIGCLRCRLM